VGELEETEDDAKEEGELEEVRELAIEG